MRSIGFSLVVALALLGTAPRIASGVTPAERCAAYQLAATGQRISAKLHCRAWASLTGAEVDAACLDKAEKRFLLQLQDGGPDCATPDEVVSLGAAADAQMNAVIADLQPESPSIPSVTGRWRTETIVGIDPTSDFVISCEFYKPRPCPDPGAFAVIGCDTRLEQTDTSLRYESTCSTTPESGAQFPPFTQSATGSIDPVTGEWLLSGSVSLSGLSSIAYEGEGVFAADGRSMTGFTTAGWSYDAGTSLWLATTKGSRVD